MSDVKGHDTSYEWKIILLLSITFGLVGLDRFVLPVVLQSPNSTMAADLGIAPEAGGTLAGYLGMAWGIAAFVMGFLADKLGRRAVMVPAIVVFSLMSVFSGLAEQTQFFVEASNFATQGFLNNILTDSPMIIFRFRKIAGYFQQV